LGSKSIKTLLNELVSRSDPEFIWNCYYETFGDQNEPNISKWIKLIQSRLGIDVSMNAGQDFERELYEIIQEINDDPQGEYDESSIENEITGRVDEYQNDIQGFIDLYGFDKNFIMEFIDLDKLTETVVSSDGYGNMLNSYDGDYDTFNINGTEYYVMRVN
jgi:uncharacterized membrane-anchored protein YjiN (DUF445 family)